MGLEIARVTRRGAILVPGEAPDNPERLAAYRALYDDPHADLSEAHLIELRGAMRKVTRRQGDRFPE